MVESSQEAKLAPKFKIIEEYDSQSQISKPAESFDSDEEIFYSCETSTSIELSDGDEDVFFGMESLEVQKSEPVSIPVKKPSPVLEQGIPMPTPPSSLKPNSAGIGIRMEGGRVISTMSPGEARYPEPKRMFRSVLTGTPRKESGFVIVQTPKEYDIITDILSNEQRNLSESMLDYMSNTYNYLRSWVVKKK